MTSEEIHAVHVAAYHDRRVPMPAHVAAAFARAVQLAREAGVTFPPGQVQVWAYRGREDEPGLCFPADRPIPIYLNVSLVRTPREWVRHICHELAHAYFDARENLGFIQSEQSEVRANRFAARALERWR